MILAAIRTSPPRLPRVRGACLPTRRWSQRRGTSAEDGVATTAEGVTAWIKDQYVEPQGVGQARFVVAKGELVVDCQSSRWKLVRVVAYAADGHSVIDERDSLAEFQPITRGGASDFAHAACKMAALEHVASK